MSTFDKTDRTTVHRKASRASYDRDTVFSVLDEGFLASVAVSIDNQPHVQPMLYARDGERLVLHGSATNRLLNQLRRGAEVCLNVTLVDGLVLARSIAHHSMNYRSVTIYGKAEEIVGESSKRAAMKRVFDSLISRRWEQLPPVDTAYLNDATIVFSLPLLECVVKVRAGPPDSNPGDYDHEIWSGVLPFAWTVGAPIDDPAAPDDAAQREGPAVNIRNYKRPQD